MPKWLLGWALALRWWQPRSITVLRPASGVTTLTILMPARLMAITGLAGFTAACSWASAHGTAGAGDMAGMVVAMVGVAADTVTDVAATAMDVAGMPVEFTDTLAGLAVTLVVARAVDLAAAMPVVDLRAMQADSAAVAMAAVADTGKS